MVSKSVTAGVSLSTIALASSLAYAAAAPARAPQTTLPPQPTPTKALTAVATHNAPGRVKEFENSLKMHDTGADEVVFHGGIETTPVYITFNKGNKVRAAFRNNRVEYFLSLPEDLPEIVKLLTAQKINNSDVYSVTIVDNNHVGPQLGSEDEVWGYDRSGKRTVAAKYAVPVQAAPAARPAQRPAGQPPARRQAPPAGQQTSTTTPSQSQAPAPKKPDDVITIETPTPASAVKEFAKSLIPVANIRLQLGHSNELYGGTDGYGGNWSERQVGNGVKFSELELRTHDLWRYDLHLGVNMNGLYARSGSIKSPDGKTFSISEVPFALVVGGRYANLDGTFASAEVGPILSGRMSSGFAYTAGTFSTSSKGKGVGIEFLVRAGMMKPKMVLGVRGSSMGYDTTQGVDQTTYKSTDKVTSIAIEGDMSLPLGKSMLLSHLEGGRRSQRSTALSNQGDWRQDTVYLQGCIGTPVKNIPVYLCVANENVSRPAVTQVDASRTEYGVMGKYDFDFRDLAKLTKK